MFSADRAFFQRPHQSSAQLFLQKRLAATVTLDHWRHEQLSHFVGCEARIAAQTLATAAHLVTGHRQPGVNDPGIGRSAERAMHCRCLVRGE
jgi:hypothetical protein